MHCAARRPSRPVGRRSSRRHPVADSGSVTTCSQSWHPRRCAGSSRRTRSTAWAPGSASSRCRSPCSTTRTARSRSPRCSSPLRSLPAFVVPALVARVETSTRRGELSGLYLFEAVATTALAVLRWHFWLPAILLLAALDGTAALAASALLRAQTARTARVARWKRSRRRFGERGRRRLGERQPREARAGGRAPGERGDERRLLRHVRARPGARRRARRRGGRAGGAVHRRRLVPGLRRVAARPAPPRRGRRQRPPCERGCAPPGSTSRHADAARAAAHRGGRAGLLRVRGADRGRLREGHAARRRPWLWRAGRRVGPRRGGSAA